MKRIQCSNSECNKTFAKILDDGTIDVKRQTQRFTVVGEQYSMIGTCSFCQSRTTLVVAGGELDDSDLTFKDKEDEDGGEENEPGQDPNQSTAGGNQDPEGSGQPGAEPESGEPVGQPGQSGTGGGGRKYTSVRGEQ